MDPATEANMSTEKSKARASLAGRMALSLMGNSIRIRFMGLGFISGRMVRNITGNGRTMRCPGRESSPGTIIDPMWGDLSMINNMGRGFISIGMGRYTRAALKRA